MLKTNVRLAEKRQFRCCICLVGNGTCDCRLPSVSDRELLRVEERDAFDDAASVVDDTLHLQAVGAVDEPLALSAAVA